MKTKNDEERYIMRIPTHPGDPSEIDFDAPTPTMLLLGGYRGVSMTAKRLYSALLQAYRRGESFPAPQSLRDKKQYFRRLFEQLKDAKLMRVICGHGHRTVAIELALPERRPIMDLYEQARRRVACRLRETIKLKMVAELLKDPSERDERLLALLEKGMCTIYVPEVPDPAGLLDPAVPHGRS